MKTWTGKIEKKFKRDFQGTALYSFKIEGVDRWFRTGKEELTQQEGQIIEFTERNSQVDPTSVTSSTTGSASTTEVAEKTAVEEQPSRKPTASTGTTMGERLAWEAARRDACNLVVAALTVEQKGLEVLPWAKNTAKAKRLDLLVSYVNQLAKALLEPQS